MSTTGRQILIAMVVIIAAGFLIGTAKSANAQVQNILCRTPGGSEIIFQGNRCPVGYVFVRYVF